MATRRRRHEHDDEAGPDGHDRLPGPIDPGPIDRGGPDELIAKGRANPQAIRTMRCRTIAEGRFRHANYIRNLPPYIVDEPPALLGDDTAPNPSEASLAALGSCVNARPGHHRLQAGDRT